MYESTLCYLEYRGSFLMLLRNKKQHDLNEGKWVGVGGKLQPGETPDECLVREVREETGFELASFEQRGIIRFESDVWESEVMYLYAAVPLLPAPAEGEGLPVPECDEGTFAWIPRDGLFDLPTWEGDRLFLEPLLAGEGGIRLTVRYEGDALVEVRDGVDRV